MKDNKYRKIPIEFEVSKKIDSRFTFVKIYLMHLGLNLNGSVFTKDVVEKCWNTLALTPILGFIKVDEENDKVDFDGHKNILVVKDGEYEIKYIGQAYGCIGENCNPRWELKTDQYGVQREYLVCDGVLWSGKYSDVKEIIDRDNVKKESMELDEHYSGYFDDNNNFVFSDFKFYGACMLANKKTEAMTGACVVKQEFSIDEFKQEIQTQMELLKTTLNQQSSSDNEFKNINETSKFTNEGGQIKLEERLELLKKFSNLTQEDMNSIANLDSYTLEDLEKVLKTMSDKKNFDILTGLNEELTNKVVDLENSYSALEIEKKELETKFSTLETEKVELQTKFDELQIQFNTIETTKVEVETKFSALETEVEALRTFKETTITAQRKQAEDNLFEMFSEKLTQDELQSIKDVAVNYSIEDLEDKLYVLVAKKEIKFEKNTKTKLDFTFDKKDTKDKKIQNGKPYDDILEQYINK